MTNTIELRSRQFSELVSAEAIMSVLEAPRLRLILDEPLEADAIKVLLTIGHVVRGNVELSVLFPHGQPTREVAQSLDETLLGALIWGNSKRTNVSLTADRLTASRHYVADRDRRLLLSHTSLLSARDRETFKADLAIGLRAASIFLPEVVLGPLATIGFEVNSNAEEYGAVDDSGRETLTLRFLTVRVRDSLAPTAECLASRYLTDYAATHTAGTSWLELIVVDTGVGLTYPSYYLLATESRRANTNVFQADPAEERQRLKLVLEDYRSAKGRFGRSLNTQTAIGEGTKIVRFQIASVRGFAAVRSGRSSASWWHTSATLLAHERRDMPGYEVDPQTMPLFRGTLWQVLIPLDTQLRLL